MRKRTRRKHYALSNPIALAIDGARITDDLRLDQLRLRELSALEAFKRGVASIDDWKTMADVCNLVQTLVDMGVGPEARAAVAAAEAALLDAHQRYLAAGRLAITGAGMRALDDLYQYHDLQRSSIARSEYERAIVTTMNRVRSAHPSLKVCAGAAPQVSKEPAC